MQALAWLQMAPHCARQSVCAGLSTCRMLQTLPSSSLSLSLLHCLPGDPSTAKLVTKFNTTSGAAHRVKLSPTQFHFHTHSEHVIDGEASVVCIGYQVTEGLVSVSLPAIIACGSHAPPCVNKHMPHVGGCCRQGVCSRDAHRELGVCT